MLTFDSGASTSYRRDRSTAADNVLNDLRNRILSGELGHGERIPSEKELASVYDVSPPTIREAIRALSAMRLVEVRRGTGTFVIAKSADVISDAIRTIIHLDNVTFDDVIDLSEALCVGAVRKALEGGQKDFTELRQLLSMLRPGMTQAELDVALRAFLVAMVSLSGNRLGIAISEFLIDVQISFMREQGDSDGRRERTAQALSSLRTAIVDALEAGDSSQAEAAVRAYWRGAHEGFQGLDQPVRQA